MTNDNNIKKDSDFLSQIPDWEKEYKESDDLQIDFSKSDWKDAKAEFTEKDLYILGCAVMEDWETPYMKALAEIACLNGGVVLELGFGMAISADFIQQHNIAKHIIIEANHEVAEKARIWAAKQKYPVHIIEGLWEEVIEQVPDESLDGILFDTYPLTEKEIYQNHFNFFPYAFRKLRAGGVFTYYSDEVDHFGEVHLKKLQEAGFKSEKITSNICPIVPPVECEYWKANTILSPKIFK